MNIRTALAVLVISAVSAAAATDASAADVDARKTMVPLTTADLLRLVSTTNKARALFKDARRRRSSSSRHRGSLADQGGDNASGGEGGLRFLAGGEGGDSCEDTLDECRADLGLCQSETDGDGDGASFLYVQMAQTCKIKEKTDGKGKVYYELSSKDMDDDTYALTDRPFRAAEAMSTRQFFKDFDATFSEETGGRPNTAVTFRHRDTGNFEGPLISVFVEAAYRKDSGKYVYELTQSEEQEEVSALKDFFRKGDGRDDGIVEYEMCSLFIDSSDDGCSPEVGSGGVDKCGEHECAYQKYEKDCKACMCYSHDSPWYCLKYPEEKAKCVDKRENGEGCHENWQCKSGRCGDKRKCKKSYRIHQW